MSILQLTEVILTDSRKTELFMLSDASAEAILDERELTSVKTPPR